MGKVFIKSYNSLCEALDGAEARKRFDFKKELAVIANEFKTQNELRAQETLGKQKTDSKNADVEETETGRSYSMFGGNRVAYSLGKGLCEKYNVHITR